MVVENRWDFIEFQSKILVSANFARNKTKNRSRSFEPLPSNGEISVVRTR